MRMSSLFGQTLRDAPGDAEIVSHRLLVRAGFIRQLGAGIFSYLPFAKRSLTKIENIMRAEINAIGGQEVTMPVVQPADNWKETGRWYAIGAEMGRFLDKNGRDMVLAMTHEEVVADLTRKEVQSYRQLPMLVYHIQTKWRDDPRPRAGLIRVREFTMLDSYSLDADEAGLDQQYRAHYQAYFNIFNRCGLPAIAVGSDVGMMGGSLAHEYMFLTPIGEDTLLLCDQCGYAANRQIAHFRKPAAAPEAALPAEKVATPNAPTIQALADLLGVPTARTAKAVFLVATVNAGQGADLKAVNHFVFALVRGDMELNETKLANALHATELRPAREDEITAVGAVPGYASPVGLKDVWVVADEAVTTSPNLVGGANEAGYHLRNLNYGRDFTANLVADIAAAGEGDGCPNCGSPLRVSRGVEVGNIFKLGTRYTAALGANFLDRAGQPHPVIMGSYGIGSGRLLACVAEAHNDADGLIWPISVAPYQVHLVVVPDKAGTVAPVADQLYADLQAAGVEVLYDDRDERAGVKFKDADLIGLPLRLTVGERALKEGGVEFKRRDQPDKALVPVAQAVARAQAVIVELFAEINARVVTMPYPEAKA
ncbi:MAG: proline--tRNA ligase [Anaerolineales bacterium]|nr:proline--tRNA ligase [Anaerolineales bacterium]